MTNLEEYPNSGGVPPELYSKRMKGERYKDFKKREKESRKVLKTYFRVPIGDVQRPSVRILKRIQSGHRSVHSLRPSEKSYISNVIGFERYREADSTWRRRLRLFLENVIAEIGTNEFWKELKEAVNEHRANS